MCYICGKELRKSYLANHIRVSLTFLSQKYLYICEVFLFPFYIVFLYLVLKGNRNTLWLNLFGPRFAFCMIGFGQLHIGSATKYEFLIKNNVVVCCIAYYIIHELSLS